MAVRLIVVCYDSKDDPKRLISFQPFVKERDSKDNEAIGLQTLGQEESGECGIWRPTFGGDEIISLFVPLDIEDNFALRIVTRYG